MYTSPLPFPKNAVITEDDTTEYWDGIPKGFYNYTEAHCLTEARWWESYANASKNEEAYRYALWLDERAKQYRMWRLLTGEQDDRPEPE